MSASNAAVTAIFKRDLRRWFGNPTGYVFISLFVAACSISLYWPDVFFRTNLANLDSLNAWFPNLLLFFIPAITMTIWAGERAQGTDELLFTLPASDLQIVLGKLLAAVGIYSIALLFCLPLLFSLEYLGDPDWGLLASNILAYWLLGVTFIAAGMVGSQLSNNLTIAFIFGAIFCGALTWFETLSQSFFPESMNAWFEVGPIALFEELGRGVISINSFVLFFGITGAFVYLNLLLLSRRHWGAVAQERLHLCLRLASLTLAVISANLLLTSTAIRIDATAEQLHSLSKETHRLLAELPTERPVYVQAFVSKQVPQAYVQKRRTLLNLLSQYDALGGSKLSVRVVETENFTPEADEALEKFAIQGRMVLDNKDGQQSQESIFLGLAITCGLEEVVIPFMDRGLSVEYELTRSIRTVAQSKRLKVGILDNDVKPFGGFEFQTMRQDPQWEIVRELMLQYDVKRINPDEAYDKDLEVLIALMPSSLTQSQLDRLEEAVLAGVPTLMVDDPIPVSNPNLSPSEPKGGPRNPFQQGQPPSTPKGNIVSMLVNMGISWDKDSILWQAYNPHQNMPLDREYVFIAASSNNKDSFNPNELITSGLQEVVSIFGGHIKASGKAHYEFIPLLSTTLHSGSQNLNQVFVKNFLGGRQLNPNRPFFNSNRSHVVAAKVLGPEGGKESKRSKVVFVADLDMVSSMFFAMRSSGNSIALDNVSFILNCVDDLAGTSNFIELRKRRPTHRTLTLVEKQQQEFEEKWAAAKDSAETEAKLELAKAQNALNDKVAKIENDKALDRRQKEIKIASAREVEQRRLDNTKRAIDSQKGRSLSAALSSKKQAESRLHKYYRWLALGVVPTPAVIFGILILMRRQKRERDHSVGTRTLGGSK